MENTQQERRNYIPDASIIAKLVEEFQKQDNELSQTGEYIIPAIETPLVQKSPYGSFASNQLLITLSSNAECSSVIRALFIVGASSTYRMMSVYGGSGELLSRERTVG